jgi:hypothetical protein
MGFDATNYELSTTNYPVQGAGSRWMGFDATNYELSTTNYPVQGAGSGWKCFERNPVKGRLEQITGIHEHKEPASTKFNFFAEIIKYLGRFSSPKEEEDRLSGTRMALSRAGYRGENATALFFGTKTFLTVFFLIIAGVLFFCFADFTNVRTMLYALLAAAAGFYLPTLWIRWKAKKRTEQVRNGFPDLLDLLVVCMGAGQALDAALVRVGKEISMTNPVLGEDPGNQGRQVQERGIKKPGRQDRSG